MAFNNKCFFGLCTGRGFGMGRSPGRMGAQGHRPGGPSCVVADSVAPFCHILPEIVNVCNTEWCIGVGQMPSGGAMVRDGPSRQEMEHRWDDGMSSISVISFRPHATGSVASHITDGRLTPVLACLPSGCVIRAVGRHAGRP